jgi:hypothetical protein
MSDLPTISSHLPDLVTNYILKRAERLAVEKHVEELAAAEKELFNTVIAKMREQGLEKLGTSAGTVKLGKTEEPVSDFGPAFYQYIKDHDAWELLHKRVTITAVKERWEAGEEIPGVTKVDKYKLSVSKS